MLRLCQGFSGHEDEDDFLTSEFGIRRRGYGCVMGITEKFFIFFCCAASKGWSNVDLENALPEFRVQNLGNKLY